MTVFLLILKIIGIVLCVILGILAVILFVPICYELDADIDAMEYKARVHWLGKLIRFEFRWKEKAHAVLKILWIVIDFTDPEAVAARKRKKEEKARKKLIKAQKKAEKEREKQVRKEKKGNRKKKADLEVRAQQRAEFHRQQEESKDESAGRNSGQTESHAEQANRDSEPKCSEAAKTMSEFSAAPEQQTCNKKLTSGVQSSSTDENKYTAQDQKSETIAGNEETSKEKSGKDETVGEKASAKEKFYSIREKAGSITDKIKTAISVIQFLREQELIGAVWVKLQIFLLHIRPRVLQGHLKFGLSNPADTGQILGGIAMIPFLYQTELQIEPDFEADRNYIQGKIYSRGHMCCIHLVILIVRLIRDKRIRDVIHAFREKK